jgi:flagellar hook-associated protein 2
VLTLQSARYGSGSTVSVAAGAGADSLFGASPVATGGLDIAGTINGAAASGAGRVLTATAAGDAEGLSLRISATAPGSLGTVKYTIGQADAILRFVDELVATGGALAQKIDGLSAASKGLDRRKDAQNDRLAALETRYRAQFIALDGMLARMSSTSSYLAAQLQNLPGSSSK